MDKAGHMNGLLGLVPWIFIFGIFYMMLIRPQQRQAKERKALLNNLKRGDYILTNGGLYATIVAIKGTVIEVKLNDEVKAQIDRSAVASVIKKETVSETETPQIVK